MATNKRAKAWDTGLRLATNLAVGTLCGDVQTFVQTLVRCLRKVNHHFPPHLHPGGYG